MGTPNDKPHGRDEIRRAVLDAAAQLFMASGFATVSLRDVATTANVNLGLIHRHIGSREDLIRETLLDQAVLGATRIVSSDGRRPEGVLFDELAKLPFIHLVCHAVAEGRRPETILPRFPMMEMSVRWMKQAQDTAVPHDPAGAIDPRIYTAAVGSMVLGWIAFGEFLTHAAGAGDVPKDEVRNGLLDVFRRTLPNASGAVPD